MRSPGFEPGIASLEGLCPKPARRRPRLDTSLNRKQQNKSIQPRAEEAIIKTYFVGLTFWVNLSEGFLWLFSRKSL